MEDIVMDWRVIKQIKCSKDGKVHQCEYACPDEESAVGCVRRMYDDLCYMYEINFHHIIRGRSYRGGCGWFETSTFFAPYKGDEVLIYVECK